MNRRLDARGIWTKILYAKFYSDAVFLREPFFTLNQKVLGMALNRGVYAGDFALLEVLIDQHFDIKD